MARLDARISGKDEGVLAQEASYGLDDPSVRPSIFT